MGYVVMAIGQEPGAQKGVKDSPCQDASSSEVITGLHSGCQEGGSTQTGKQEKPSFDPYPEFCNRKF